MASAKKCDRCGKFYQIAVNLPFRIKIINGTLYTDEEIDLCHDCMAELRDWIDEKKDKKTF